MSNLQATTTNAATSEAVLAESLWDMIRGFIQSEVIFVAAKMALPDHLAAGVRMAPALAEMTGSNPDALRRLLRGLVICGVCTHDDDDGFSLTPLGELLRSDHPRGIQNAAILQSEVQRPSMEQLHYSVRTGKTGIERALGAPLFEYLARNEETGERFDRFMTTITTQTAEAVLATYDLSQASALVDVGGGRGTLVAAILARYPAMRGVVFDLPHVAERAREYLTASGVADRANVVSGDFFVAVPAGADVYTLSQILHDWDDAACTAILSVIRAAMTPGNRLLVLERIMPERTLGAVPAVMFDLIMLTLTSGLERTETEYRRLLFDCGFEQVRVVPTDTPFSVIEARAA